MATRPTFRFSASTKRTKAIASLGMGIPCCRQVPLRRHCPCLADRRRTVVEVILGDDKRRQLLRKQARPSRLTRFVENLVVADLDHGARQPERARMALQREVDAIGRRIGLVVADRQRRPGAERGEKRPGNTLVVVVENADLPGPRHALVDRREGMDRNQPCAAAGTTRPPTTAETASWNGCHDSAIRGPPLGRRQFSLPGIAVVSLTAGMRSGASSGRLQSITSRETRDSISGASSCAASARATGSAPGSQAMWRASAAPEDRACRNRAAEVRGVVADEHDGAEPALIADAHSFKSARIGRSTTRHRIPRHWSAVTNVTIQCIDCALMDDFIHIIHCLSNAFRAGVGTTASGRRMLPWQRASPS